MHLILTFACGLTWGGDARARKPNNKQMLKKYDFFTFIYFFFHIFRIRNTSLSRIQYTLNTLTHIPKLIFSYREMFYCSNTSHVVTAFVNNIDIILAVDSDPLGGYWVM